MANPRFKKRFGQNHLVSGDLCRPLVDYLRPAGESVLEIGPGGGILTEQLVRAGARVTACEVDREWAFYTARKLRHATADGTLRLAALDVLDLPWERWPVGTLVAGNLPFNVGTRILETLLPHAGRFPRAAFMVQKEVAERLVAEPGTKAYGALSVLVASHAKVRYLGTVKPGSFRPPPKVSAAFVGLELVPAPYADDALGRYHGLVRLAFSKRRKTLYNCLGSGWGKERAGTVLDHAGIDRKRRAESLDLTEFRRLFIASEDIASED